MTIMKSVFRKAIIFFLDRHFFILVYLLVCCMALGGVFPEWIFLLTKLCFIWGCTLVAHRFLFERELWITKGIWFIIVFLFINGISLLLNLYSAIPIIKDIAHNSIFLLLMYPQNQGEQGEKEKKFFVYVNDILIVYVFILTSISLIQFVFNIQYQIPRSDIVYHQGMWENRLFGLYSSPNVGALYGFLSVVLSAINSLLRGESRIKFSHFAWANIGVQFCYFALSSSRGGLITICSFLLLIPFIYFFPKQKYIKGIFKAAGGTVGVSLLLVVSFVFLSTVTNRILPIVPNFIIKIENVVAIKNNHSAIPKDLIDVSTVTRSEQSDFSSDRFDIWNAGLKAVKQVPFFGFGTANIYNAEGIQTIRLDESELTEQDLYALTRVRGNMHNVLMETILSTGILGLTVFVSFAVYLIIFYIKRLCKINQSDYLYQYTGLVFCLIGALAVNSLVESHVLFSGGDPVTFIFWLYLGSAIALLTTEFRESSKSNLDDPEKIVGDETV